MAKEQAVISFRVPTSEYEAIQRAAQVAGESMSLYIRKAVEAIMRGATPDPAVYVSVGAAYMQEDGLAAEQTRVSASQPVLLGPIEQVVNK
jgi:hypothetical protein